MPFLSNNMNLLIHSEELDFVVSLLEKLYVLANLLISSLLNFFF